MSGFAFSILAAWIFFVFIPWVGNEHFDGRGYFDSMAQGVAGLVALILMLLIAAVILVPPFWAFSYLIS